MAQALTTTSFCDSCKLDTRLLNEHYCVAFIKKNVGLFRNKVVLDLGCRSGYLTIYAIEYGQVEKVFVWGVGAMTNMASYFEALLGKEKEKRILQLEGALDDIILPGGHPRVDIILSEWIGSCVFGDSLFKELIYARDNWLVPGGIIIPNLANLYIAGISYNPIPAKSNISQVEFSNEEQHCTLLEEQVKKEQLMTEEFLVNSVNMHTAKVSDIDFEAEFKLKPLRDGQFNAFAVFYNVGFIDANGRTDILFSTSPKAIKTNMEQVILLTEKTEIKRKMTITGYFGIKPNEMEYRGVELSVRLSDGEDKADDDVEIIEQEGNENDVIVLDEDDDDDDDD
ncbi:protein arginine N-methyltransferase 1 [Scaptodrosophila lebanonensis]|uniref:Protein arginine N-methyltransferase 1 n=1 Tax=Drosophila lebanonensis TaxID=7225 RepID=A0A6J2T7U4_DROLE|nr:protein arginine N-methyltransferase 1 [Scaptodrosophila lebanonensis]